MKLPDCFLVVDDDTTNNLICELVLGRLYPNTPVKSFTNPVKALQSIADNREADKNLSVFLFLDINMPDMTGWDFLEEFKNFGEDIHKRFIIYIFSSSVDERDIEKADSNPFVSGFLSKPLEFEVITEMFAEDLVQ